MAMNSRSGRADTWSIHPPDGFLSIVEDRDRSCPACGTAFHLHREARDRESAWRQCFEVVQFFEMAVADVAAGLVAFPDDLRVMVPGVTLSGEAERGVPAPAIDAGDAHAALGEIKRRIAAHA